MFRRLSLAAISLAIFVGLYFLYVTLLATPLEEQQAAAPEPVDLATLEASTKPAVAVGPGQDLVMGGQGQKSWIYRWTEGRLLYQFRVDAWESVGDNRFQLTNPELRYFSRSGEIVHVSAPEGLIEGRQSSDNQPEPQRGTLKGKVHVFIDRGTNPERGEPELRPEDVVHIWLDSVDFDLEKSIIISDSPLQVDSDEAELTGRGLTVRWNETTNELEEITIAEGDKLIWRMESDMLQIGLPGSTPKKKGQSEAAAGLLGKLAGTAGVVAQKAGLPVGAPQTAPAEPPEPQPQVEAQSPETLPAQTQPTTQPRARAFEIAFGSDVSIFNYDGPKLVGKATCDELNLVITRIKKSKTEEEKEESEKPRKRIPRDGKRLEIFWSGPLVMKPAPPPEPVRKGILVRAIGQSQPVDFEQTGEVKLRCKKLVYQVASKQGELYGTAEEPVKIEEGEGRTIVATRMFYDYEAGLAHGEGPGYMQQVKPESPRPGLSGVGNLTSMMANGKKRMVLWQEGFVLNFGKYRKWSEGGWKDQPYLERAEFRGAARMSEPSQNMAGELIVMDFFKPEVLPGQDEPNPSPSTVHVEKNVTLQSEDQQIDCDVLDVTFVRSGDESVPSVAEASGTVKVRQGQRLVEADQIVAHMEQAAMATATQPAAESRPEGLARSDVRISRFEAEGDVRMTDPDDDRKVECRKIDCRIGQNNVLEWCYLEGEPKAWASVVSREYAIAGHTVTMDLTTEQVDVPGAGELQFVSEQDIEGSRVRKGQGVPILINWSESMQLRGTETNQGTFLGGVTVRSRDTTLSNCERLIVDFEQRPEEPKAEEPARPEQPELENLKRFWVFARSLGGRREEAPSVQLPVMRKQPVYIQAFPKEGEQIEVVNERREGETVLSRATLFGQSVTIDLAAQRLNVPSHGRLLIGDFERDSSGGGQSASLRDPFGQDLRSGGPSQTAFEWQTGLTYLLDSRVAIFDGDVRMVHVADENLLKWLSAEPAQGDGQGQPVKPDRWVDLTCQMLKVEFIRGAFGGSGGVQAGAAELKQIDATGTVKLEEGRRTVMAQQLRYDGPSDLIVVYGSNIDPAYIIEENPETAEGTMWKGPRVVWNRRTNEIRAPKSQVIRIGQ